MDQVDFFKALGDDTRLRALMLLAFEGELCVCELMEALELPQPKISRHMGLLRDVGVLSYRRQAQWVFYCINPELSEWRLEVIKAAIASAKDCKMMVSDRERLQQMKNRPERCVVDA